MRHIERHECDEDAPTVQMSDDQRQRLIASVTPPTGPERTLPDLDASLEGRAVPVTPQRISRPDRPSLRWWTAVLATAGLAALTLLGGAAVMRIW